MGRKVPARKHHGVRDPIKQAQNRYLQIKDKINNPPTSQKDQKLSYKLNQLAKLRQDAKTGKVKKRQHVQHREDKPRDRLQKKFQPIEPREDETATEYMRRVNRITSDGIKEAEYEAKYGVQVIRNEKTGQITIKKRPKDEITELMKAKQKGKGKKQKLVKPAIDPKLAKSLIKQAIEETKKEQKKETKVEEYRRDTFRFGEVVQAPPSLVAPRRAPKNETVPRPGKKNSLLLKKMLDDEGGETAEESVKPVNKGDTKKKVSLDLKGKRKDLPRATRRMIEEQQTKAVELYRQMKKNKMKEK
ncbi:unnamed protein product [Hermetia illucens]|uniref:Coiled-coil domain-containing protein 137 n=1 Tax=Hermetia illucens TaxID=343691 RepID=A0A7R8YZ42_HERIL|nr:coiled-coil domain-containing protein 137 [Hermetia illucens]CAD7090095.1 unnamed protein product [Hermetia illucens]